MCIIISCTSNFQPFSSHGTHKLLKFCSTPKTVLYFCWSDKNIGIILIHSHRMLFLCWPLSFFLFNNLRGKRSVPLTRYSGIACFKKILWQSSWKSLSYTIIFITSQTLLTSKCLATLHIIYKAMLNTLMYILLPISDYSLSVELLDQGYF